MQRLLLGFVGLWVIWLLLVGQPNPQELLAGAVASLLVVLLSWRHLKLLDGVRLTPLLPWHVLRYLLVFFKALLLSNFDMARRVLSPRLPIDPAVVTVATELTSPLAKLLLANSITLTPGTLTVDVLDERLEVHWIDITPGADLEAATRAIAADFEVHLRRFLR